MKIYPNGDRVSYGSSFSRPAPPRFEMTPEEIAAHRRGLQLWYRQFHPTFSEDPMTLQEFAQMAPNTTATNMLRRSVRPARPVPLGPTRDYAYGGDAFEELFSGATPPQRALYWDNVFGVPRPFPYRNQWGSNFQNSMNANPQRTMA
jgi:hypothetical protein